MFKTITQIKIANKNAGFHFFDRKTLKFFNSKVESRVIRGNLFITSERFDATTPRRFTVRAAMVTGAIKTVGGCMQHATLESAKEACKALS